MDGRNRFKACEELGVKPEFLEYSGNDPLSDVISWNLKRRHLSESQRGIIAASLANMPSHRPNKSANLQSNQVSQTTAAEMLNVSPRTVASAKKIQEEAIPEIVEKVKAGEVSINAATIASTFTEEEQAEIVEEINAGSKPVDVIKKHVHVNKPVLVLSLKIKTVAASSLVICPQAALMQGISPPASTEGLNASTARASASTMRVIALEVTTSFAGD